MYRVFRYRIILYKIYIYSLFFYIFSLYHFFAFREDACKNLNVVNEVIKYRKYAFGI